MFFIMLSLSSILVFCDPALDQNFLLTLSILGKHTCKYLYMGGHGWVTRRFEVHTPPVREILDPVLRCCVS